MPGKGELVLTGQLGDVMKEIRARGAGPTPGPTPRRSAFPDEMFDARRPHPRARPAPIPKDGPSAGVTMATALIARSRAGRCGTTSR